MKPRIILVLLFFCLACSEPSQSGIVAEQEAITKVVPSSLGLIHEMQGRWNDGRIKGSVVLISGKRFVSIYRGEVRAEARLEVFEECPLVCREAWGSLGRPEGKGFFILYREDGPECYLLERLEVGELRYRLLAEEAS